MKVRLLTLVALLALVGSVIGSGPIAASAQGTPEESDFDVKDLAGVQEGVSRTYSGDLSAFFSSAAEAASTPGAELGTPDVSALGLFSLNGAILRFDNTDNAKDAFGTFSNKVVESASTEGGFELKDEDTDGFSDNTKAYSAAVEEEGISSTVFVIITQEDEFIYLTTGISFSPEAGEVKDSTVNFTKALVDGKAGDGEGELKEDGTSTGGLWDKFPAADDEVLQGLKPVADQQVYPQK